jgi:hypothetical protein
MNSFGGFFPKKENSMKGQGQGRSSTRRVLSRTRIFGESTHKRRATVKSGHYGICAAFQIRTSSEGAWQHAWGVHARAATPETLYTQVVVAFVRKSHERTRMKLTLDLLNRCWHAPTKAQESRARRVPEGGATWLAPVRFTRNPSSMGLTKKKLRPCTIFTNNTYVLTTLALRSDWAWTLRTLTG